MAKAPKVFVSYARSDASAVGAIVDELRKRGVDTWRDAGSLMPGDDWATTINNALLEADAVLFFVSRNSMESKWVTTEVAHTSKSGIRVLPVIISPIDPLLMPAELASIQWLDATSFAPEVAAAQTAEHIVKALRVDRPSTPLSDDQRFGLAEAFAAQTRGRAEPQNSEERRARPDSVFIVHGHDEGFLGEVERFLTDIGVEPIVMKNVGGATTSLLDKFFEIGGAAEFAIVLLGADDLGASCAQYDTHGVGEKSLQFRGRQNVILELGFFYGSLGWENVFVLEKAPVPVFPNFERPSDLEGVVFDRCDETGKWKRSIRDRLKQHGFELVS